VKRAVLSCVLLLSMVLAGCGGGTSSGGAAKKFDIRVTGTKSDLGDFSATKGDKITLTITTDKDEEVHLHGYDIHFSCKAGTPLTKGAEWTQATRATAAHSTLTIADTSSSAFVAQRFALNLLGPRLTPGPAHVEAKRQEVADGALKLVDGVLKLVAFDLEGEDTGIDGRQAAELSAGSRRPGQENCRSNGEET